ncbi:hypothetical protein ACWEJZ_31730 [Streptomyces bacillaris]
MTPLQQRFPHTVTSRTLAGATPPHAELRRPAPIVIGAGLRLRHGQLVTAQVRTVGRRRCSLATT